MNVQLRCGCVLQQALRLPPEVTDQSRILVDAIPWRRLWQTVFLELKCKPFKPPNTGNACKLVRVTKFHLTTVYPDSLNQTCILTIYLGHLCTHENVKYLNIFHIEVIKTFSWICTALHLNIQKTLKDIVFSKFINSKFPKSLDHDFCNYLSILFCSYLFIYLFGLDIQAEFYQFPLSPLKIITIKRIVTIVAEMVLEEPSGDSLGNKSVFISFEPRCYVEGARQAGPFPLVLWSCVTWQRKESMYPKPCVNIVYTLPGAMGFFLFFLYLNTILQMCSGMYRGSNVTGLQWRQ